MVRHVFGDVPGFAVLGLGKLGGRDLGYASDLDVIFSFLPSAAPDPQDATTYFVRGAQRVIRLLTESHAAGPGLRARRALAPLGLARAAWSRRSLRSRAITASRSTAASPNPGPRCFLRARRGSGKRCCARAAWSAIRSCLRRALDHCLARRVRGRRAARERDASLAHAPGKGAGPRTRGPLQSEDRPRRPARHRICRAVAANEKRRRPARAHARLGRGAQRPALALAT